MSCRKKHSKWFYIWKAKKRKTRKKKGGKKMKKSELYLESPLTGQELKQLREQLGLNLTQMAEKLNVARETLWRYEIMNSEKPRMFFVIYNNLIELIKKNQGKNSAKKSKEA